MLMLLLTSACNRHQEKIVKDEKKLHGAADKSSSDQHFCKLDMINVAWPTRRHNTLIQTTRTRVQQRACVYKSVVSPCWPRYIGVRSGIVVSHQCELKTIEVRIELLHCMYHS